jgi:amino acid permease
MLTGVVNSGGAIGAGLFIGSGGAFQAGGPASVLIGFMIVGKSHLYDVVHTATHWLTLRQVSWCTPSNVPQQRFSTDMEI